MEGPTKNRLIERLKSSYSEWIRFLNSLSEVELKLIEEKGAWRVEDYLIHLAKWEEGVLELLKKRSRRKGMGISLDVWEEWDIDKLNLEIFDHYKDVDFKTAKSLFEGVTTAMVAFLNEIDEETLLKPYRYFDPETDFTQPVVEWVTANTFYHFERHLAKLKALVTEPRS